MDLDSGAFTAAFKRIAKRLKHKRTVEPEATFEETVESYIEDEAISNFISLLVVRDLAPKKKFREKDLLVKKKRGEPRFVFYPGDLEVKGNFGYERCVLVQGDLIVSGMIEDKFESSPLLVGGNVRAKGMYLGSETMIDGKLDVDELIYLRFTRGGETLRVEGGAKTKLYVYTPDDSKMTGKLVAKHTVEAYPERDDPALAKLRGLLTPALAKSLDAEEPDMTLLVKAVTNGTGLWR